MMVRCALSLASLAAILAIAGSGLTKAASNSAPFLVEKNVDAPGYDYRQLDDTSLKDCRSQCAAESACGAFTYNTKERVCFLKSSNEVQLVPFKGAITGVKTAGQFSGDQASAIGQYVVDGFALGAQIDPGSQNYLSYKCEQSDEFADAMVCNKQRKSAAGNALVSSTLIHDKDGTALYGMVNVAPVNITEAVVTKEIGDLSKAINANPAQVVWLPSAEERTSVIAIWGPIELQELGWEPQYMVGQGENPHLGILIGALGDPRLSAEKYKPVYRLVGGPGYVYSASFGSSEEAHRRYVAIDASALTVKQFQLSLRDLLKKDASLASDDYSLWSDVALLTRNLALDTSPDVANQTLDNVFDEFESKKLKSRVWSVVPSSAIKRLGEGKYWRHDIYGPRTKHPKIRSDAQNLIAKNPTEPFIEFAYFIVGDLEGALEVNPSSVISDPVRYGSGHRIVQSIVQDAVAFAQTRATPQTPSEVMFTLQELVGADPDDISTGEWVNQEYVNMALGFINRNPDLFDRKPLAEHLTNFADRAAEARQHFEYALNRPSSPHADDAAYMIGWLEMHQGNTTEAMEFFSRALKMAQTESIGEGEEGEEGDDGYEGDESGDYEGAALRQNIRIIMRMPPPQQFATVESSEILSQEPSLWYVAARSAYRNFDYARTIEICEEALDSLNIPIEVLPVTTSPERISAALGKINPAFVWDLNLVEIPYLVEASRELLRYEKFLRDAGTTPADAFAKRARAVIMKYSMIVDRQVEPSESNAPSATPESKAPATTAHKDLRQALHLIDITLEQLPKDQAFEPLREWLYYRKGRVLAIYAPHEATEAVSELQKEFPESKFLDDALAERIFAEGVMLGDVDAAQRAFDELLAKYPNGNSVDNAYSWMAIIFRCAGRREEAAKINRQIVTRFPLTRHAKYALQRMADPDRWVGSESGCGSILGSENP